MNWHFIFSLLDLVGWLVIAIAFHHILLTKATKEKGVFLQVTLPFSLFAGMSSVLYHGLPEIGFSLISFLYVFVACLGVLFYYRARKEIRQTLRDIFHPRHIRRTQIHAYERR